MHQKQIQPHFVEGHKQFPAPIQPNGASKDAHNTQPEIEALE